MKRLDSVHCLLVLFLAVAVASCGSGGGNVPGGGGGGQVTAAFTPDNNNPGADSISMGAGTAMGNTFQVIINVTDITDFFGAGFRIAFNSASAEFLSFDGSGSFLHNHPNSAPVTINAAVDPNDAGTVLVVATIQNSFAYTPGFASSATPQQLLILNFRATNPTGGNAFTFDLAGTREVTTCPQWNMMGQPPACNMVPDGNLTWDGGTLTAS